MVGEKRRHKRIKIDLPMSYIYSNGPSIIMRTGKTRDLSDSGMCFYSSLPFRKGLSLHVNIKYLRDFPRKSTVRWCEEERIGLYKIGVCFM
jgi:hypothetical protein